MSSLRQRFFRWLGLSIGNRFAAVMLALTLGFMVLAGGGNFVYLIYLTRTAAEDALNESTRDVGNSLERALSDVRDDVRVLANNPTVVSAVLDAQGQETYLHPLLSRFRPDGRTPIVLCVTDYRGRKLGCASTPAQGVAADQLTAEIALNRPSAHLSGTVDKPVLRLVQPVQYEGTGNAEGAVIADYDLSALLLEAIGDHQRFSHVHLMSGGKDVYVSGTASGTTHASRPLTLGGAYVPLRLELSLGVPAAHFDMPLFKLMVAYGALAIALVWAAFRITRWAVPTLIGRLSSITVEANRVAEGEAQTFVAGTGGSDEISQLARAFATMTQRLRDINLSLERQVDARTAELRRQEAFLHSIIDTVPGAIVQLRLEPEGRFRLPFVSQALREVFDLGGVEEVDDARALYLRFHPADRDSHMSSLLASARDLLPWRRDFRIVRRDGTVAWLNGNAVPQREEDGTVVWHGIVTDITEQKRAELALAESEAYTKALFEHSYIPLVIMDPHSGLFLDCNDAAVTAYRLGTRGNVIGRTPLDVSAATQYDGTPSAEAAQCHIEAARDNGLQVFEWHHRRPDGELWDAEVRLMRFRYGGQELLQFSLRDITEQKRSAAEVWRRANFDPLTGLANRALCRDRLERALAQARRSGHKVGALFIDLDGFKAINDTLGHATGDVLLREAARRLERCVREQDTAARFGGDEFVLVVHDLAGRADLRRVAEEVVATLAQPFSLGEYAREISGSVGIAVFPDDAEAPDALLEHADQALYRAKKAGRNQWVFYRDTRDAERI